MSAIASDPLEIAIAILAARCDGAVSDDRQGFNGADTVFGHSLAEQAGRWTAKQRASARTLVQKYRRQVLAATGIDVAEIQAFDGSATSPRVFTVTTPATPRKLAARDVLGPGGSIAQRLAGYEHRDGQLAMADLVAQRITDEGHGVIEAGTGTGKSYGYLVPAILSGKKTIVSTAVKSLQDQLIEKDIPFLQSVMPRPFTAVLLKGRSNYACLHRIGKLTDKAMLTEPDFLRVTGSRTADAARQNATLWRLFLDWREHTESGDLDSLSFDLPSEIRSEVTVTSEECFSGDTRYLTWDGVKTLGSTVGTNQRVLTMDGTWSDAEIHAFGVRKLWKLGLRRNGATKEIFTTEGHRWFVQPRTGENNSKGRLKETVTSALQPGQRLASRYSQNLIARTVPSQFGIAHGIVFGDGGLRDKNCPHFGTKVQLWGDKDALLRRFFSESPSRPLPPTDNGVCGSEITALPRSFKELPSLDESISYLYGWLSGYFATDGCVDGDGTAVLFSATRTHLEYVRDVATRLGIGTGPIRTQERIGRSGKRMADAATPLHNVTFIASSLRPNFFLSPSHLERFEQKVARGNTERSDWFVVSVEETDESAPVYCAVVPHTHSFVLEDNILTSNCLGKKCPLYDACFAERAKSRARDADVVVVNHALLIRDLVIRAESDGHAHILPDAEVCVLDESHQLENSATSALGGEITAARWRRIDRKIASLTVGHPASKGDPEAESHASDLYLNSTTPVGDFLTRCLDEIKARILKTRSNTMKLGTESMLSIGAAMVRSLAGTLSDQAPDWLEDDEYTIWQKTVGQLRCLADDLTAAATPAEGETVRYGQVETGGKYERVVLHVKPVDVAPYLRRILFNRTETTQAYADGSTRLLVTGYRTVIAASATLADGDGFEHWRSRVGLDDARELRVGSPFDYTSHALLYLPPDARTLDSSQYRSGNEATYFDNLAASIGHLLAASKGRAFCLFTSNKALRECYDRLWATLPYRVLKQGDRPKAALLAEFKAGTSSVLFATKGFWEGADVAGEALSLVVIDKLPFAPPDDPLWEAKCAAVNRRAGDQWAWFSELAVPEATIALKQGVGRLIRSKTDIGVFAILDSRLVSKKYGATILRALPPAPVTQSLEDVQAFFAQ